MSLRLEPVLIATGSEDEEGRLVFLGSHLVAVLVQLSDRHEEAGKWFLEAGFGRVDHTNSPIFMNLEDAQAWIEQQLAGTMAHT